MIATDVDLPRIRSVLTVTSNSSMFVTTDTLLSLQIFRPDMRSAIGRGASTDRDGGKACLPQGKRSIFDLFHSLALTSQGRSTLREIFTRPSTDLTVIKMRHQSISDLLDTRNRSSVGAIRTALKSVRNILPILAHLRSGLYLPGHFTPIKQSAWRSLLDFCFAILQVAQTGHGICTVIDRVCIGLCAFWRCQVCNIWLGTNVCQTKGSSWN